MKPTALESRIARQDGSYLLLSYPSVYPYLEDSQCFQATRT